jgi:glycosyltransferase involved in cell wall biosynthesis
MIEAMSTGTPVIAWRNGSVPEVIDHGRSGWIVSSIEEAVDSVERISELPRARVRECFESRFTSRRMAADYLEAYQTMLGEHAILLDRLGLAQLAGQESIAAAGAGLRFEQ